MPPGFGIPLHPLGEMSMVDFIMEKLDNIGLMQARLAALQLQVAYGIITTCIFASNPYLSLKMVMARP
jgi:hypothetical protein